MAEFDRARHISRVNYGLNSPEQFPAIELSIASYLAMHNYAEAVDQQKALVAMHKSSFGTEAVELVPRLLTLGDMYFAAFERGLHQNDSGLVPGFGAESNYRDPAELTTKQLAFLWLQQAQATFMEGITILMKNADLQNPQLLRLEANVLETLFLMSHRQELEQDADFFISEADARHQRGKVQWRYDDEDIPLYREGEIAFKRILVYLKQNPAATPLQTATVMLQLGDWHFLFNRYPKGRAIYQEAQAYLQQSGVDAQTIAALLAPEVPVQLPTFMGQPHSRARLAATQGYVSVDEDFDGYIDVSFKVNANGTAKDIEIIDKSANANAQIEARLRKVLRNAPFRPQVVQASDDSDSKFAVRYYFAQL